MSRVTCCFKKVKKMECLSRTRCVLSVHDDHCFAKSFVWAWHTLPRVQFGSENSSASVFSPVHSRGTNSLWKTEKLILGWQVSTASIVLSAESSCFFSVLCDFALYCYYCNIFKSEMLSARQCVYKVIRLTFPSVSDILGEAIIDMWRKWIVTRCWRQCYLTCSDQRPGGNRYGCLYN